MPLSCSLLVAALFILLHIGCSSPTAPTPTPMPTPVPPPVAEAPSLSCLSNMTTESVNANGITVAFETPSASNGQSPVTVACTPASGTTFPIGSTTVTCTATDGLNRTASCTFDVAVRKLPQLSRTRFLAFGDSITAGEVSFPVAGVNGGLASTKQVIVHASSYPTVLAKQLQARYPAQVDDIVVANYGLSGEKAALARTRFIEALNTVRPTAVLLMEGSNDIARGEDGAASGAASEIRNMAAEARLRGMRVFIATVPPGRPGGEKTIAPFLLLDYAGRMRAIASSEGAVLVDIYQALLVDVTTYIGVDGLHPNERGYARIAETFFDAIRATLEVP